MMTRRNTWVIQALCVDGPCKGQWVNVHEGEAFAEAVKFLTPDRRIVRNGKVLRPRQVNRQRTLFDV